MRLAAADHRLASWESLLDELDNRQLAVLMAFNSLEGIGEERGDKRTAIATAAMCQASRMSRTQIDPQQIFDAMRPAKPEATASPQQQATMFGRMKPKGASNASRR